jgi:hypothetical protein
MVFEIQTFNLAQIKHLHTTPSYPAFAEWRYSGCYLMFRPAEIK